MSMVVSHWSVNAAVVAVCALAAVVHLLGMRVTAAVGRTGAGLRAGAVREAAAFYAGLLMVILALVSPVGYWAQRYVWVRSVQDLLLAVVAPALIVLGAPWLLLARGAWRHPAGRRVFRAVGLRTVAVRARAAEWLSWPVVATVAFNIAWWGWHSPLLYDAALREPVVYAGEVVTYLGLGALFWLQLIGSRPVQPQWPPLRRVVLITGTIVSNTALAMVLVFGATAVYPSYRAAPHSSLGAVADQQVGGAVLWVLIMPPLIVTAVALLVRWLAEEDSDALTAGFDRLLKPPRSGWSHRPGLR